MANTEYNLAAGSDLSLTGTVTNTGTSEDPVYEVSYAITNRGDSEFSIGGLYVTFTNVYDGEDESEADRTSTPISRQDFNSKTLSPGKTASYIFSSGPTTGREAKISGGQLTNSIGVMKATSHGVEIILFAYSDLPTVFGNATAPAELAPGESMPIDFNRVDSLPA